MKDSQSAIDPVRPMVAPASIDPVKEQLRATQEIMRAVRFLNKTELEILGQGYKYAVSQDIVARRPVVKLVDEATGATLYQIPPDQVLRKAAELRRKLAMETRQGNPKDGFETD